MDIDDRLKWLETRISSSLRPRADELKSLFIRDETRATLLEFFTNDEAHQLFVYTNSKGAGLSVSLSSPRKVMLLTIIFII